VKGRLNTVEDSDLNTCEYLFHHPDYSDCTIYIRFVFLYCSIRLRCFYPMDSCIPSWITLLTWIIQITFANSKIWLTLLEDVVDSDVDVEIAAVVVAGAPDEEAVRMKRRSGQCV
jgi:hypothetical protein